MSETCLSVPESEFWKLKDELKQAQDVRVPYDTDQLKMAQEAIETMQMHIYRALERMEMIEHKSFVNAAQEASL